MSSTDIVWSCNVGPPPTLCTHQRHNGCLEHGRWRCTRTADWGSIETHFFLFQEVKFRWTSSTVPLTLSYWQHISPSATFSTFSKVEAFISKLTTSRLHFALQSSTKRRSLRQARQLAFISEFTSDIRHIHGESNPIADALSRNVSVISQAPVKLEVLASAQLGDREIQQLSSTNTSLQLDHSPIPNSNQTVLCDTSQGNPRPRSSTWNLRKTPLPVTAGH